jgi:hypothetical protein
MLESDPKTGLVIAKIVTGEFSPACSSVRMYWDVKSVTRRTAEVDGQPSPATKPACWNLRR